MNDIITMLTPAAWHRDMYREATPIGSGRVGALVYGRTACELIQINDHRLWHRDVKAAVPDIGQSLQKTRDMIDSGDFMHGSWISTNALKDAGYAARLGTPHPLCDIAIDIGERGIFEDYRRELFLDTAQSVVSWSEDGVKFERRAFVSAADDTVCVSFSAAKPVKSIRVSLITHDTGEPDTKVFLENCGASIKTGELDGCVYYTGVNESAMEYGAALRVDSGAATSVQGGAIELRDCREFTLFLKTFADENAQSALCRISKALHDLPGDYDAMLRDSAAAHGVLYRACDIRFDGHEGKLSNDELLLDAYKGKASKELLEKLWHFGRYLMICGTGKGGYPFPLYGLWHGRYSMAWPHNMANENVQMIYWHALSGNLLGLMEPLIDYYMGHMDTFRENARAIFGLPGIYLPAGTTPGNAVPNQIVPVIMNWIGCAGWLSQHFYNYYLYTRDEKLLRDKILPFMYEAALFYEAYMVRGDDGRMKIYPSVSPENTPGNLMPPKGVHLAHPCPSVINATMDIAIIKELFTNLITVCESTGEHTQKIGAWKAMIGDMPPYGLNADGAVREWQHDALADNYYHRHLSHLYPVFPGTELVMGQDDEALLGAFERAVDLRQLGAQSGWSLAHMACIYARFENGEKAARSLDALSKACLLKNFFTLHNDWRGMGITMHGSGTDTSFAPVQLDALMGCVNAIQEMLLYSNANVIKLLPALPKRLDSGRAFSLRTPNAMVDMSWGNGFAATVTALYDADITIIVPRFCKGCTWSKNGVDMGAVSGAKLAVAIKKGDRIAIFG